MSDEEIPEVPPADVEEHDDEGVKAEDYAELEPVHPNPMPDDVLPEDNDTTAADLDPVTRDESFRRATLLLLEGEITVDEWLDSVADALNRAVDIPWIPEAIEQRIFEYGLRLAGQALHGFLRKGTENSNTNG